MPNERSNTAQNSVPGKPFTKGDPRINRKGRPKSFDQLSALAKEIAHEKATNKGGEPVIIDGHAVTVAEIVLRQWFQSSDFRKQQAAMEIAFGKVPQPVEVGSNEDSPLRLVVEYVNKRNSGNPT